jgi:hypothetical protein
MHEGKIETCAKLLRRGGVRILVAVNQRSRRSDFFVQTERDESIEPRFVHV